jgi:hypothetical protein
MATISKNYSTKKIPDYIEKHCRDNPYYATYVDLDPDEQAQIDQVIIYFANTITAMGIGGALELVGALGRWMIKNDGPGSASSRE